ncbi:hypothetical protein IJJ05_01200 [Candidatus Saccharibacteria bacterium]|nr:hypothetical protein [Candidatus Saccharibacteria bacterium]
MEQNVDTGAPIAPVTENNKQNGGNGLKIATAIACIVAVCGIGFGVYGILQNSQKDNQISELNSEITQLKQSIEKLENTIENTSANNNTSENSKTNIIIDDWKLNVKIPESISVVSYTLDNDGWLSIVASPVNNKQKTATVGLIKVDKTAVESGNAQQTSLDDAVFLDDDFAYYLMYTNTTPERDLTIDKLIIDALSDSTLYSKI